MKATGLKGLRNKLFGSGPKAPTRDEQLVMKQYRESKWGIVLHIYDFGGQTVFNVMHHLFLTRNGRDLICDKHTGRIGGDGAVGGKRMIRIEVLGDSAETDRRAGTGGQICEVNADVLEEAFADLDEA